MHCLRWISLILEPKWGLVKNKNRKVTIWLPNSLQTTLLHAKRHHSCATRQPRHARTEIKMYHIISINQQISPAHRTTRHNLLVRDSCFLNIMSRSPHTGTLKRYLAVIILANGKLYSRACFSLSALKRQNTRSKTKIPFFKEVL